MNFDTKTVIIRQTFLKEIKENVSIFLKQRPKDIEKLQRSLIDQIKNSIRQSSKQGNSKFYYYLSDITDYVDNLETQNKTVIKLNENEKKAILTSILQYFEIEGFDCSQSRYPVNYSANNKTGENVCISWDE